ncbi:hypothetical protein NHH73_07340 [Oxalobacteraceae bacterium OTU3CINTB1]|nr:hypothetical protein NHH73_07340 [Oxalobacteraceae bacterium OTU3CINTB1]
MTTLPMFVAEMLRYFVGLLLLAAAVAKLRGLDSFRENLTASFDVGAAHSRILAPAVVLVELAVAALVLGGAARVGLWAALTMFCVFTALLGYKFHTHGAVRCACFGGAERSLSGLDLLRNVLVIGAIGAGLALGHDAGMPPHAVILAIGLATLGCVLAVHFHEIVRLLAAPHG